MRSIFLLVKDFNFIGYVRKGYPEGKAYKASRQSMIVWMLGWYLALLIAL